MSQGKDICKELKAVRRKIAEENGIELEIPECTYNGPCKGTCPRCESEVRYLENELAMRIKIGKVASVAGLALTLAVSNGVKAQSVTPTPDPSQEGTAGAEQVMSMHEMNGTVVDEKTQELLPFVNVVVKQNGRLVSGTTTDFDGNFVLRLAGGDYEFLISTIGYAQKRIPVKVPSDLPLKTIKLESTGVPMEDTGLIDYAVPLIDPVAPGVIEGMEVQGVQVRVQF